ncbi:MAG: 4'-phosphopantetheinyl transferase superfamily protein [Gemmatimonadota bacterium]
MQPIGIGLDLVDLARARQMLERHGDRVLRKFLTAAEQKYVVGSPDPAASLAARIAAKEAAYKSLQVLPDARGVGWHDLEVIRSDEGRPSLGLHGQAAVLHARHGPFEVQLSLTHTAATAGAVALLLGTFR